MQSSARSTCIEGETTTACGALIGYTGGALIELKLDALTGIISVGSFALVRQ